MDSTLLINRIKLSLFACCLGAASFVIPTQAQTTTTDPVGFYRVTLLGDADTVVSLPFTRPESAACLVESYAGNVVTVTGASSWTQDEFVYSAGNQANTYYVLVRSGAKEGNTYTVLANDASSVTIDLNGDTLVGLNPGDRLSIIPYWTLNTVFPDGKGVHTSPSPLQRYTEVFVPNLSGEGINLVPKRKYYFHNGYWKEVNSGTANRNDDVLVPEAFFIVRHNVSTNTTLTTIGGILLNKLAVPIASNTNGKQDNFLSVQRPVPFSLNESGLIASGAFSPSISPLLRTDELYTFDNNLQSKNKAASGKYYYLNGTWRSVNAGTNDVGDLKVFGPGTGFIIRKNAGSGSALWVNATTF